MSPIPPAIRAELEKSADMSVCVHNNCDCSGRIEWEHALEYARKQIQEVWAIIGCCYEHHRGGKLNKEFNRYCALKKAIKMYGSLDPVIKKYPKRNWLQEWTYLNNKYGKKDNNKATNSQ